MASGAAPFSGSDGAVVARRAIYLGFSLRETAGSTATLRVYDNASAASGTIIDSIQLSANESAREWYGPDGILVTNGIYVDVVSGTVEGSFRTR